MNVMRAFQKIPFSKAVSLAASPAKNIPGPSGGIARG